MVIKTVKAEYVDSIRFNVITPHRTYYFKASDNDTALEWVKTINSTIAAYCSDVKYH